MVKNIINQGLAALYNPEEIVDLENQYRNTYGIKNSSSGLLSDARHMSAMNNLSNTLSKSGLGIAMGLPSELAGDIGAFGAGLINELPALGRGFNKQNLGEIVEDIKANYAGSFGTPNTATARGIYDTVFKGPASTITTDADVRTAANIANNYGTAQAAEVTPTFSNETEIVGEINGQPIYDYVDRIQRDAAANAAAKAQDIARDPFAAERSRLAKAGIDPMSVGLVGGTGDLNRPSMADVAGDINLNITDLGNPTGDPRIASEEQGLSGFPGIGPDAMGTVDPGFQNALNAREARMNEIAMQQNPNYGQFFDAPAVNEPKRGIDLGLLGLLAGPAGFLTGSNALRGIGLAANIASGRVGRGLGSLNRRMRGVNPDGTTRTQSQYEAARDARRTQNRIDNMLSRKAAGKSYSEKNLQEQIGKQIAGRADKSGKGRKGGFTNPGRGSYGPHRGGGGNSGGGGGGKIVCTMMNDSYGFGNFRNKIWLKHSRDLPKEYEVGYHTIFLPLVKFAKGEGKLNKVVKKILEHIARHRTYDLKQEMKGKTHLLGRAYRKVLEPICFITGKIKSALGRG